jgi:hypothetical protein
MTWFAPGLGESTLKKELGRFRSLYGAGQAAQLAGRHDLSQSYFRELLKVCEHADTPGRTELIEAKRVTAQTQLFVH